MLVIDVLVDGPGRMYLRCTCGWLARQSEVVPVAVLVEYALEHASTHGVDEIRTENAAMKIEPRR